MTLGQPKNVIGIKNRVKITTGPGNRLRMRQYLGTHKDVTGAEDKVRTQ